MNSMKKYKKPVLIAAVCVLGALAAVLAWRGNIRQDEEQPPEDMAHERAEIQEHYTLGKVAGANNANLPVGDTYEDNAYTRYLKNVLNIQNENVFALEADGSYEKALEAAISDRDIPDVMVVNGRDNLIRLVESGLVEDLTDVYE